jgi:2-polyprenyl-3-methyl-5-hydroxy-6-metoxy-1,4-benzoquinol methylase
MKRPKLATVILPLYGVADAVSAVIADLAVAAYSLRLRNIDTNVLLVDGGGDDAAAIAKQTARDLALPVVTLTGPKSGPGEAYLAGFREVLNNGLSDLVITLDANGRHDATQIPRLIDRMVDQNLDIVIGSRWTKGSGTPGLSLGRWVLGRLANLVFRAVTATHGIADATTSFRLARIEVIRDFAFKGIPVNSHSVQTAFVAMAVAKGYKVGEAPIIYRPPIGGGGGLGRADIAEFSSHLVGLRKEVDRARQRRLSPRGRVFTDNYFGAAQDLERLGTAKHFFDWVLEEFNPYLHGRVLEVGAGLGTITRKLIERYSEISVVALEPAENVFVDLASYAALTPRVTAIKQTLAEYYVGPEERFETILYLNVLEHIEDDARELRLASEALLPGGAVLVFAPALEPLYSELDYRAGHYRRYSLRRLRNLAIDAGLTVRSVRYFDVLGVPPYFFVYKFLGHGEISGSTLWWYDRIVVPISRLIQRAIPFPPLGKNIILVAVKSDA